MKKIGLSVPMLAAVAALGAVAFAQKPTPKPSKMHGMMSHMMSHMPAMHKPMAGHSMAKKKPMGSSNPMMGNVIGNKATHVYHLPGDRSTLPSPANRVYFKNETAARFAGYHKAKMGGVKPSGKKMMSKKK